jgi:hypothetical protein
MRPFISPSCSREDDRFHGSASVCVWFPAQSMRASGSLSCPRDDDRLVRKDLVRVLIALGANDRASSPSFPLGVAAPVGTLHVKAKLRRPARGRRPRRRVCLRKGCRRKYQPRRWNQRYCQDPECLRQVHRWQAARRQAKRRQDARVKVRHAQAEKQRRQRAKTTPKATLNPEVAPARGHAAENFFSPLMRSTRLPRTPRDFHP